MLEDLNEYLGKEKAKFKVLKKDHISLQNNFDMLKEEHESLLLKEFTSSKVDIGIMCDLLDDMPYVVANLCISSKISISTSYDDLLDMPCSSSENVSTSSMLVETNLVEENKELKDQVTKLKNDLERSYKGKRHS